MQTLQVDHVIPRSEKGPDTSKTDLQLLHCICHLRKKQDDNKKYGLIKDSSND